MAAHWTLLFITLLWCKQCQGQMCTMGFLSAVSDCSCVTMESGHSVTTQIIPEMSFTCSGTVTHWRAAGEFSTGGSANRNSILTIWREKSSEPGTYNRVGGIELGICGSGVQAPLVVGMSNVYECTLPQSERVAVQPGDIVGTEISERNRGRFRLYFDSSSGPTNYIFNQQSPQTVILNQNVGTELAQPQISLTVERTTEVVPTTPPVATTSPTTEMIINTDSVTTTPLATTSPTTEITINTDSATTLPIATTSTSPPTDTRETLTIQNSAPATTLPSTTQSLATTRSTTAASDTTQPQSTTTTVTTTSTIEGQICTRGFPTAVSDCPECATIESFTNTTRIITGISFTCNGTVMYWRAAGEFSTRPAQFAIRNSVLSIWRERSSGLGIYDRVGGIQLGICGSEDPAPLVTGMSSVYECYLPQSDWVTVQSGDIVGIELPIRNDAKFRLHFRENSGPKNFIFDRHSSSLNPAQSIESELALPQISLTDTSIFTTEPINTVANTAVTTQTIMDTDTTISGSITANNTLTIAGSAVGGVLGVILLSTVAILILALVLLVRKYRRDLKRKETGIATVRTLNVDTNANLSYIPVFHQISTGNNVAYVRVNDGYTTIMELTENNTQVHGNSETQNDSEEGLNDAIYESIV